jgi:RHS repeat-associated protein
MTDGSTTSQTVYTHGPNIDEPLAIERDGSYAYYHADGLGSVVSITDPSRNVLQTYTYDAFGSIVPSTPFRNSFTYTGREYDEETGLYFYRARYYDPRLGRFLNVDPIGFDGGDTNLYAYVGNNPVNRTDPKGLRYIPCGKAAKECLECIESAEKCKKKHEDPIDCQLRGENPGGTVFGHILITCLVSNPECDEGCIQALIRCAIFKR